jgi:hypothetical protein
MQIWKGWTTTAGSTTKWTLTWAEWRAHQQRTLPDKRRQHAGERFTERERAHLSFVRWLYHTGRLGSPEHDNDWMQGNKSAATSSAIAKEHAR